MTEDGFLAAKALLHCQNSLSSTQTYLLVKKLLSVFFSAFVAVLALCIRIKHMHRHYESALDKCTTLFSLCASIYAHNKERLRRLFIITIYHIQSSLP